MTELTDTPVVQPAANFPAETPAPEVSDDFITTEHTLASVDGELKYTATTGRLVLRQVVEKDDQYQGRKPKAEVFITAYKVDDGNPHRPITFAFNGGPGSSSIWLHMGLLGPRRAAASDAGDLVKPPYGVLDNPETLLRVTDLVFIDPVSTGLSRPIEGESAKPFHGFTGDLESVGEIIRLWVTRNGRWLSPKFIIGESYGGTRAAALADYLQRRFGMYLNGVVLIAPALNLETIFHSDASDLPYPLFLPAYAAAAHYHGKLPGITLEQAVKAAQDYADEYRIVLAKGGTLSPEARTAAINKLAAITSLSPEYLDRANLRPEHLRVLAELLRDKGLVVGRLDARYTGPTDTPGAEKLSHDPFDTATEGPFNAAWNHYLFDELDYHNDDAYEATTTKVNPWSYKEFEGSAVDVANRLANAIIDNPHLAVLVLMGRYDAGVPVEAIEYSLNQMPIPANSRDQLSTKTYAAGHMMYLNQPIRKETLADLAEFIRDHA